MRYVTPLVTLWTHAGHMCTELSKGIRAESPKSSGPSGISHADLSVRVPSHVLFEGASGLGNSTVMASPLLFVIAALAPLRIFAQKCQIEMNIVIDESGSVTASGFQSEKNFAADLVSDVYKIDQGQTISVISYDTDARVQSNWVVDDPTLPDTIRNFARTGGGATNTDRALQLSRSLFDDPNLDPDKPRIIVLLSDGSATDMPAAEAVGQTLRNEGVLIYGIYIGSNPDGISSMERIASEPSSSFVFQVTPDFNFGSLAQDISTRSCINATSLSSTCGLNGTVLFVNGSNLIDSEFLRCRYTFSDGSQEIVNANSISSTYLKCGLPSTTVQGDAQVEVSIDGRTFQSNNLVFRFVNESNYDCLNATVLNKDCGENGTQIFINGTNLFDNGELKCRYTFSDGTRRDVKGYSIIPGTYMRCGVPNITINGDTRIEVSIDGQNFQSNNLFFEFVDDEQACGDPTPDVFIVFIFYGAIIPALLVLSLAALFDKKNAKTLNDANQPATSTAMTLPPPLPVDDGKSKEAPAPPVPNPIASVPPPKGKNIDGKWDVVDATGYLWPKSGGGTAPMQVNWHGLAPPSAPEDPTGRGTQKIQKHGSTKKIGTPAGQAAAGSKKKRPRPPPAIPPKPINYTEGNPEKLKESEKSFIDDLIESWCCCFCCTSKAPSKTKSSRFGFENDNKRGSIAASKSSMIGTESKASIKKGSVQNLV